MLNSEMYGTLLQKIIQALKRQSATRGKGSPSSAYSISEDALGKVVNATQFVHLINDGMGIQAAAFRSHALFNAMSKGHRSLTTAEMRHVFDQAASSSMFEGNQRSRVNDIWRAPHAHTHTLKSFAGHDPNREAVDHDGWGRRPSASNGTSVNILGARRPGNLHEMFQCREEFTGRRLEQALKSVRGAMVRRFKGKDVKATFNAIDSDGNGGIDRRELAAVLRKLGLTHMFPIALQKAVFTEIDTDGNGLLDYAEFINFLGKGHLTDAGANQHHKATGNNHLVHMHEYKRRAFS
jgi:hypothetical protein